MSLDDAKRQGADELLAVLHFPPTNEMHQASDFTKLFGSYGVKKCISGICTVRIILGAACRAFATA